MNKRETLSALLLASCAASPSQALGGDDEARYLHVQVPMQVALEVVTTIAHIGQPESITLAAGHSPAKVVLQRCGALDPAYLKLLVEANRGLRFADLLALEADRNVVFPACIRLPDPKITTIEPGQTIGTLALKKRIPINLVKVELNAPRSVRVEPELTAAASTKPRPAFSRTAAFASTKVASAEPRPAILAEEQSIGTYTPSRPTRADASSESEWTYAAALTRLSDTETVKKLFNSEIGASSSNFNEIRRLTINYYTSTNTEAFVDTNPKTRPRDLKPGDTIQLPGAEPAWSSVRLKAGISADMAVAQVNAAITAGGGSPDGKVEKARVASLISPVTAKDGKSCTTPPLTSNWPLNIEQLIDILAMNNDAASKGGRSSYQNKPNILILDTGFDFLENTGVAFANGYLQQVRGLENLRGTYSGAAGFVRGVNFGTHENSPASLAGHPDRWHGLGVAGVALGSRLLESFRRITPLPVKLSFANVVKPSETGPEIDPGVIFEALRFAASNSISIINVSLSIPDRSEALSDALAKYGDSVLLVAAAGNDGLLMDIDPIWPAAYGGEPSNAGGAPVITVGAHDAKGRLAPFSRHGSRFVDLLAPGCDIPTYTGRIQGGKELIGQADISGTSFAAPLVSFVAALLNAEGLRPAEIKARLLMSVDVRNELEGSVYSSGILNVTKALAVSHDTIEYIDGKKTFIKFGRIRNRSEIFTLCGREIKLSELRKLAVARTDGRQGKVHFWKAGVDPGKPLAMTRAPLCDISSLGDQSFDFEEGRTGDRFTIPLKNLIDYVPSSVRD